MDSDIHFGDIEQAAPQMQLRPDRNFHLATVPVSSPGEADLPIFVDIDVLRDVEAHALSDTRVELGGVLLGGQYADAEGKPFVVVTDSLRARHYESTKGSFKFTHETWEQFTREREKFPADLQMVGWYHTHPDWGVFLSGLDMFICDHFFNKPLDVALVIDPCRQDRGFFQWSPGAGSRTRRTDGFYLFGSRFRAAEMQQFAAQLEGTIPMSPASSSSGAPYPAPVIHVAPPAPAWQAVAVMGMLGLQFCLLLVLLWQFVPARVPQVLPGQPTVAAAGDPLAELRRREAEMDAKLEVLEAVLRQDGTTPEGVLRSLAAETAQVQELRGSLRSQQSLARELDERIRELESTLADASRREERRALELASLREKLSDTTEQLRNSRERLEEQANSASDAAWAGWWPALRANSLPIGLGAVLGGVGVWVLLIAVQRHRPPPSAKDAEEFRD
ncbi:MAG: hypothetical protein AB7F89_14860 [Pirellulaceae bacterium]